MTAQGYAFLFTGRMAWIFDKNMQLVKGIRRENFLYPMTADCHELTGAGRQIPMDALRKMLDVQGEFIAEVGEETAVCKFGTSLFTGGNESRAAHYRYAHCAVHHGPLGKHLEKAFGRR